MDQTLRQLGELLLGSIPTVILLALLYALYAMIVHKPLRRALEERRSKTEGAVEKSRADIAAAEARGEGHKLGRGDVEGRQVVEREGIGWSPRRRHPPRAAHMPMARLMARMSPVVVGAILFMA